MRILPLTYRKNDYDYLQVWRDETYAIYEQSSDGEFVAYEVFRIVKYLVPEVTRHGTFPARESVPCSEDWGMSAWTVGTMEEAESYVSFMMWRKGDKNKTKDEYFKGGKRDSK